MKKLLLVLFCFLASVSVYSQDISFQDMKNLKVDNLTNKQVKDFVTKYTRDGYTLEQVEDYSLQGGMPVNEWQKLQAKIQGLEEAEKQQDRPEALLRSTSQQKIEQQHVVVEEETEELRVFGSSLFNTTNLTFEPNLRMATPEDYMLGPDDELIIDVFGLSENTFRTHVTPEGFLRLPNVGQIHVNGLIISQAKKLITSKLSAVYTTINSGETSVSVTLGNIRSIKVIVVGEAYRPGTYTLPSVSSVFNTLNACGGPNKNGSFREIKVIRNNKIVAVIDIYDFLLTGELKNNIRLQDQDVIKIEPYKKRIELKGELKNVGYFEAKGEETLSKLMEYAGNYTTNAYKDRITVIRNTEKEKKVEDVTNLNFETFIVEDGDVFVIGSLLDRFENRVQIEGAVFRPGTYAITSTLTLKQLIEKADGIREDAFLHRGTVIREKENKETEIISFNVLDIMSDKTSITLKKEDIVNIASAIEMQEMKKVFVHGEVKNSGEYSFHQNMTLQDLVFAAGGVKENAELQDVEIYRLVKDPETLKIGREITKEFKFTIDRDLKGLDFELKPHDQVIIRPIAGFTDTKKVMIEGEVLFPGNYILTSRIEKISDIINRAGGLNDYAYPEGAFMIRKSKTSIADEKLEKKVYDNVPINQLVEEKQFFENEAIVGINLDEILKKPGSKFDLLLEDGDILRIPRELQTVQVSGQVLLPSYVRYDKNRSFKDYINGSGGFSSSSLKRKSYVVYANGTSKSTNNFLGIRNYPDITPGAKIYVPEKPERKNRMSTGETIALSSSVITLAALVISLFK